MTRRLVILTEIISPYRIPLFNCLAEESDISVHVIFLAENDPGLRQWKVYKEEIRFSYEVLPSWRARIGNFNVLLNGNVTRALRKAAPDVILCGGYNYIASWQALLWARLHNVPLLLWSESNQYDARGGKAAVEWLKAEFLRRCSGFVVPGRAALEYLLSQKVSEDKIFTAPNAVDNDLFASAAFLARQNAASKRRELGLPDRYILFVGRLVPEKGIFELLNAYSRLDEAVRQQVGLVFVGDGPSRPELQTLAAAVTPGTIRCAGFAQREELPDYYALAAMLVLPTYTDTWGLVVNEAMACSLPVIVSRVAGCTSDLIRENWNGFLVPPRDVSSLTSAMRSLAVQPDLCATMGAHSAQHIAQFSPKTWSVAIAAMVTATLGNHA
jgi:glycosyltransferase involved in cell wall biosynthesis